jgi:Spy/CpxP family protein refolding chaperone
MKKLFVTAVLFAAAATFAAAQQRNIPSVEERAKNQTERIDRLVKLTDAQKAQIQAIDLEFAKQMDRQMRGSNSDRNAMRAKIQEINGTRDKKYKETLTDEQFKKYSEDRAKREQQQRAGRRQ